LKERGFNGRPVDARGFCLDLAPTIKNVCPPPPQVNKEIGMRQVIVEVDEGRLMSRTGPRERGGENYRKK